MAGIGVKRAGARALKRSKQGTAKRSKTVSLKADMVVRLVHALTSDLGKSDGTEVGLGIARHLTDAYIQQGRKSPPSWVQDLVTHYARKKRSS